jgi:SAM-dependent methyltransferase
LTGLDGWRAATVDLYRSSGEFAWRFARGKLSGDPVVLDLLRLDCLRCAAGDAIRLVDLGCGQGLLFAALEARLRLGAGTTVAAAPAITRASGYDGSRANVLRARAMLKARAGALLPAEIAHADLRSLDIPACEIAVVLDVLHYLGFAEQEVLLRRIADALVPGGRLVLRVGDASGSGPSRISRAVDRLLAGLRGQGWAELAVRPIGQWRALLSGQGFAVREIARYCSRSSRNVLLVADKTL